MKLKCVIVDDEPLAQKVLEKYIKSLNSLHLVKTCDNALEALSYLQQHTVDVIFLDIKMPELSGIDFLKTLNNPPQIIITSAFSEYALDGYEFSVVDFLLKPFSFERFLKATNKLKPTSQPKDQITDSSKEEFIFLKADRILHKVSFSDILYVQGYGNYIKLYLDQKKILVSETMTKIEKMLPHDQFVRSHKSYIVSIHKIEKIEDNKIYIRETKIPIGNIYKKKVREMIDHYHS